MRRILNSFAYRRVVAVVLLICILFGCSSGSNSSSLPKRSNRTAVTGNGRTTSSTGTPDTSSERPESATTSLAKQPPSTSGRTFPDDTSGNSACGETQISVRQDTSVGPPTFALIVFGHSMDNCAVEGYPTIAFSTADGTDVRWPVRRALAPSSPVRIGGNRGGQFTISVTAGTGDCISIAKILVRLTAGPGGQPVLLDAPMMLCTGSAVTMSPFTQI